MLRAVCRFYFLLKFIMAKKISKLHQRLQEKAQAKRSVFAIPPVTLPTKVREEDEVRIANGDAPKRVYFMSREAVKFHRFEKDDIIISISDTGVEPPKFLRKPDEAEVLALNFHDYVTPTEEKQFKWHISTMEDGEKIAEFVLKHTDAPNVIVHCNYGQSRSKAVALAIRDETMREVWHADIMGRFTKYKDDGSDGNGRLYSIVRCAFEERA